MREEDSKKSFFEFLAKDERKLDAKSEALATQVVDCLIELHRELGPGHPERVYENALCHEFDLRGIAYGRQVPIRVHYKGVDVGESFVDVLVSSLIVLELKAVEQFNPTHRAQIGSYLVALNLELGFLANFNVALMKDGIKRVVRTRKS